MKQQFLFHYAGGGCEFDRDGAFRFIPADAKRLEDYIPLPGRIAEIEAEPKITGCKMVFGIDGRINSRDWDLPPKLRSDNRRISACHSFLVASKFVQISQLMAVVLCTRASLV